MCAWKIKNAVCLRSYPADSRQLADCLCSPYSFASPSYDGFAFNDNYSL